jgi:branched-chain amino acid transport system permease protein
MSTLLGANSVLVQAMMVNLLLALSMQIPLRSGVFSFAGIGSYGLGAYAAAIVVTRLDHPALLALAEGVLLCGLAGVLLALLLRRLNGLYLGMASIAYAGILAVVVANGGKLTGGAEGMYGVVADLDLTEIVLIVLVVVVLVALSERGRTGRAVAAVRADPELAAAMGVDVRRVRFVVLVVGCMVGGLAGGINAIMLTNVAPSDFGFHLAVLGLTMIIVGGARSWLGALVGAAIFTWLPIALQVLGDWRAVVYGALVASVAVWAPGGLIGLATRIPRAVRAAGRRGAPGAAAEAEPDSGAPPDSLAGREVGASTGRPR